MEMSVWRRSGLAVATPMTGHWRKWSLVWGAPHLQLLGADSTMNAVHECSGVIAQIAFLPQAVEIPIGNIATLCTSVFLKFNSL